MINLDLEEADHFEGADMIDDEIELCKRWLRYFCRPAKHYAPRTCDEYARRASIWAGEPIRPDAFRTAASQLHFEMRGDKIKAAIA